LKTTSAKEERDANLHSDYMTIGHTGCRANFEREGFGPYE